MKKLTIKDIGCDNLKAVKLDENNVHINMLITETIKEQQRVLALTKIDYQELSSQYITL